MLARQRQERIQVIDQLSLAQAWRAVVQGAILLGVVVAQRYVSRAERR